MNWRQALTARVVAALERHPDRCVWGIGVVFLAAYLGATLAFPKPDGQIVVGDAKHHYVQLRSIVFDRDLDFRNEYMQGSGITTPEPGNEWLFSDFTPTGHVRNYMPVGPALLWMPLYLVAVAVKIALAAVGLGAWPTGYERSLQLVPGVTGVLAVAAAMTLIWRTSARFTTRLAAVAAALAVWIGSHALYYALVSPAYSHAASIFTVALFCWYWLRDEASPSPRRAFMLGVLAGFCALMRWQDALLLAAPAWEVWRWPASYARRMSAWGLTAAGWLLAFAPQMIVWQVLYGRFFAVPQGPSFMQWGSPHLVAVLFSTERGLFTWAPLLLLAACGLGRFAVTQRRWAIPVLGIVVASWYVNGAVADWWAGEAFGSRRFLSLVPLFALGLAVWLQPSVAASAERAGIEPRPARLRLWRGVIVAILACANVLLLLQYQLALKGLESIAPYPPSTVFDMWIARFLVPLRLMGISV